MDGRDVEKGKGDEWMEGSVGKGMGDEWIEEWRRETAMSGWDCRAGKARCLDVSVEKGKGHLWLGV